MPGESNCHETRDEKPFDLESFRRSEKIVLMVSGMGCPNCAARVRNGLLGLDGVVWTEVDLSGRCAYVAYDSRKVGLERLLETVHEVAIASSHAYSAVPGGPF